MTVTTEPNPMFTDIGPCPGCVVEPGSDHDDQCDHANCPECGTQRIQCFEHEDSTRGARWHGIDPAAEIAAHLGWWTTATGISGTVPDFTRVLIAAHTRQLEWNREAQRYAVPGVAT